jgi:P-type Cu+ transporter
MSTACYHCGADCLETIQLEDKSFCCDGCKMVFKLLDENGLCQYYDLSDMPGLTAKGHFVSEKYNYLDNTAISEQLIQFKLGEQAHVVFYLPQIHCVSCVWLLENLHKINAGIIQSKTHFEKKEIKIVFNTSLISLKQVVQLLAFVGYEPVIHLGGNDWLKKKKVNKKQLYKIGIAGFCFSNIMMLSFPEYLSNNAVELGPLRHFFIYINLLLSLPVLFYSASGFFISAYTGLRQKWLNIDAPIALAIAVTFSRSVYEILSQTGAGYLDSMSGIVFFMLIGRWFQDKSYDSFAFDRDYHSFFPLGVTVLEEGKEVNKALSSLIKGEMVLLRTDEMIPADAVLLMEGALIDYSFVTGENAPIAVAIGEMVYAGGIQKGRSIQLEVLKPVGQSYITELWNSPVLKTEKNIEKSFVHPWSQYFTIILFLIAITSGIYWSIYDSHKILPAVTAVLIVACPCSLLLTVSFTYGNVLRWLGRGKLYCKNASVIEAMHKIDTIVFDKTGTLTNHDETHLEYTGTALTVKEMVAVKSVTRESLHPLSKMITQFLRLQVSDLAEFQQIENFIGKGTKAYCDGFEIIIGSASFLMSNGIVMEDSVEKNIEGSLVCLAIDGLYKGCFKINHSYRNGIEPMMKALQAMGYELHLLSGDYPTEKAHLVQLLGNEIPMLFEQSPADKLNYIETLQNKGHRVMMVGDGLNDAGALQKSNVGIAVTDQTHLFTPASDAILEGGQMYMLKNLIDYAKKAKLITIFIFILSILYNIIGMYFATSARLSPMVAAILMPISSISIVALSALLSYLFSSKLRAHN